MYCGLLEKMEAKLTPREGAKSFSEGSLQVDTFELEVCVGGSRASHWVQDSPSVGISALQPQDKMSVSVTCCDSHSSVAADKHPRILMVLSPNLKGEIGVRKDGRQDLKTQRERVNLCSSAQAVSFVTDLVF